MADFFQDSPNFINPSYVTPEQRKAQIDYANALMKRAGEGVTRPTGALGAMIDQLTANIYRNATMRQEQAALSKQNEDLAQTNQQTAGNPLVTALMNPQSSIIPPSNVASGNPALGGSQPKDDAAVQAAYAQGNNLDGTPSQNLTANPASPQYASLGPIAGGASSAPAPGAPPPAPSPMAAGGPAAPNFNQRFAQAYPNSPQYNPRTMADLLTNQTSSPMVQALAGGIVTPKQGTDVYGRPTIESLIGGVTGQRVGAGVTPGINRPIGVTAEGGATTTYPSAAPGFGGPGAGIGGAIQAVKPLQEYARTQAAESKRVAGGAGAEAANIAANVALSNTSLQISQDAKYMKDLIKSNPNQFFGPLAKPGNEALRLMSSLGIPVDTKSLAAADAVEKTNISLAASLQQKWNLNPSAISIAMGSTPGNEKSIRGTTDLLSMIDQAAERDHYVSTTLYQRARDQGKLADFSNIKARYYEEHPLKNENTGHLVMDPVAVRTPQEAKRLQKGTPIQLPDGRIGWVP